MHFAETTTTTIATIAPAATILVGRRYASIVHAPGGTRPGRTRNRARVEPTSRRDLDPGETG